MVLKAHLEPTTPPQTAAIGSRRTTRRGLMLHTSGSGPAGEPGTEANVTVHNISETGMLLETDLSLAQGETLSLELPLAGVVEAEVVWASGRLFGCAFAASLSAADLAAAQLKAETALSKPEVKREAALGHRREALGQRLNRLRREQSLTLADIAGRLGVSKPTVWAWEKGKAKPLPERYEAIAAALGVDVVDITDVSPSGDAEPVIQESRSRIAQLYGVHPDRVRIMIDL